MDSIVPEASMILVPLHGEDLPNAAVEAIQGDRERNWALTAAGLPNIPMRLQSICTVTPSNSMSIKS